MSTKFEQASTNNRTTSTTASLIPSSAPKISMFANKSGFVIPKNKLSGSLVPVFRGNKNLGNFDATSEDSIKQAQRKTKWGPDLAQDISVRKGRIIAYQTRLDQITRQLKSGGLEAGQTQDLPSSPQNSDSLELEKREAIGEILKLNPSYRAPVDYKPVLREAKFPISIKECPDYNFIGLVYGPANDTQKRLEKETGAKVQVYGIKATTGERVEITPPDGDDIHGAYDELYVYVSADTYDKVDAAVALIELLVTPISVNSATVSTTTATATVSGDDVNVAKLGQTTNVPHAPPSSGMNQGVAVSIIGSKPFGQEQGQLHPSFPSVPFQNPSFPPSAPPAHSSQLSTSTTASPFGFLNQNPPPLSQHQVLQYPYTFQSVHLGNTGAPRNSNLPHFDYIPAQPNSSASLLASNLPTSGPPQVSTSVMPSPLPSVPAAALGSQPPSLTGNSTGWLQTPVVTPTSLSSNIMQILPHAVPQGHQNVDHSVFMSSNQPPHDLAGNTSPMPKTSGASVKYPNTALAYSQPQVRVAVSSLQTRGLASTPMPMHASPLTPVSLATVRTIMPKLHPNPNLRPTLAPLSLASPPFQSGPSDTIVRSTANFNTIQSPLTVPRPQPRSHGDFTFQPHQPPNLASSVVARQSGQPAQNLLPFNQTIQPACPPQIPSNSGSLSVVHGFKGPLIANQMNQSLAKPSGLNGTPASTRYPNLTNHNPTALAAQTQIGTCYSNPAFQMINSAGGLSPSLGNPVQFSPNYQAIPNGSLSLAPNQRLGCDVPSESRKQTWTPASAQQVYDPFLPTSASSIPRPAGQAAKIGKPENDPEYEDLMASVGVK